jgi:hypothetical protein
MVLIIGIVVYWFVKETTKEKRVYKTPIEKATNLLNTLEQKGLWQREK